MVTPAGTMRILLAFLATGFAASASAERGTISGKVEATPAKYAAETVVYLKDVKATTGPRTLAMDQKGMTFIPHVLAIARGDTVRFLNHDGVAHNVYSPDGDAYNLGTFKTNEERPHTFKQEGTFAQLCTLHPEMLAYIFVAPSSYAAVVDANGRFSIKDVPSGNHKVAVWNSHLTAPDKSVTVESGKTTVADFALTR